MPWTYGTAMHTSLSKEWLFLVACAASCAMSMPSTTCTVDPVVIGDPAFLICSFRDDLQIDRRPIVAYHTKINSTEKGKIANCFWSKEDTDYTCQHQEGLLLNWEDSDKLRLTIERANEEAQGDYICQKSPSEPSESSGCRLTFLDTPVVSTSTYTSLNVTTANGEADDPAVSVTAIAVSVAVVVFVLGNVIAVLLVVRKRRNEKTASALQDKETRERSRALVESAESKKEGETNGETKTASNGKLYRITGPDPAVVEQSGDLNTNSVKTI